MSYVMVIIVTFLGLKRLSQNSLKQALFLLHYNAKNYLKHFNTKIFQVSKTFFLNFFTLFYLHQKLKKKYSAINSAFIYIADVQKACCVIPCGINY